MKDDWISAVLDNYEDIVAEANENAKQKGHQHFKEERDRAVAEAKQEILTKIDQIIREVIGEEEPRVNVNYGKDYYTDVRNSLRIEQLKRWESMK